MEVRAHEKLVLTPLLCSSMLHFRSCEQISLNAFIYVLFQSDLQYVLGSFDGDSDHYVSK